MPDTERFTWPDGSWWEIRTYLSHGTARRVRESMQHELKVIGDQIEIDWGQVDLHDLNEVMVLAGTVAWSYGAVSREILSPVPEERYMEVLQRVNTLYGGFGGPFSVQRRKELGEALFVAFSRGKPIPAEMTDAHLLFETGWTPSELDQMSEERLQKYLLYKDVREVVIHGGTLRL